MSTEFFIASRYLLAKRKGLFSMITTLIGVAGVALGVAALIVTLAIMNGFQSDIKTKIIDAQAHITVYGRFTPRDMEIMKAALEKDGRFAAQAPFVLGQAILTFSGRSSGVMVKGLDPAQEFGVNNLKASLVRGAWDELDKKEGAPALVLGEELAKHLGVDPEDIENDDDFFIDLHMAPADLIDFTQKLEEECGYDVTKINLGEVKTVADLIEELELEI